MLMVEGHLQGLPARKRRRNLVNAASAEDLVCRDLARSAPNQLWLTDITEHSTREGKIYCCVILDAHSRRVIGWSDQATTDTAFEWGPTSQQYIYKWKTRTARVGNVYRIRVKLDDGTTEYLAIGLR